MIDFFLDGKELPAPADSAAALILLEDEHYLLQARDQKPGIYYPGHWGLFGGALDPGEAPETALRRELEEEIGLTEGMVRHFTDFSFDFPRFGRIWRHFYEVRISPRMFERLRLSEGCAMRAFPAAEILNLPRVVPYDSFAIYLHAAQS